MLGSSLQHSYCEADRPGLRVAPAFVPINVLFLSLKEELNERKRLEEKAWKEQMSEKCFTWADWVCFLKCFEGDQCIQDAVKDGGISHSSLFPSLEVNFSPSSEKQESHRALKRLLQPLKLAGRQRSPLVRPWMLNSDVCGCVQVMWLLQLPPLSWLCCLRYTRVGSYFVCFGGGIRG